MSGFKMDDYVDVAQRIHDFYERFPDGRLCTGEPPYIETVGDRSFVIYHARAYRTPDDPVPGDGWAWEPIPGPTQFTKDSELMNAETAAWGRAIVALGFATKKIASAQEFRNRQQSTTSQPQRGATALDGAWTWPSGKHQGKTLADTPADYLSWYAANGPKQDVRELCAAQLAEGELLAVGAQPVDDEDIPF